MLTLVEPYVFKWERPMSDLFMDTITFATKIKLFKSSTGSQTHLTTSFKMGTFWRETKSCGSLDLDSLIPGSLFCCRCCYFCLLMWDFTTAGVPAFRPLYPCGLTCVWLVQVLITRKPSKFLQNNTLFIQRQKKSVQQCCFCSSFQFWELCSAETQIHQPQ